MDDADARTERDRRLVKPTRKTGLSRLIFNDSGRERLGTKWKVITDAHCAPDKLDVAAKPACSYIQCVCNQKSARIHIRALTQIERVRETDRIDLILSGAKKEIRPDLRVGYLDVSRREDQRYLVVLCDFAAQLESSAQLKFCVAIVIKRQRKCSRCENKIRIKEERVLVQDFTSVTSLRNLN